MQGRRAAVLQVLHLFGAIGSLLDLGATATTPPSEKWPLRFVFAS
jgi:hypothetical protein